MTHERAIFWQVQPVGVAVTLDQPLFVKARLWFDARKSACEYLGCSYDDITLTECSSYTYDSFVLEADGG